MGDIYQTIHNLAATLTSYYPLQGDVKNYSSQLGMDGVANGVLFVPGKYGYSGDFTRPGAYVNLHHLDRYTNSYTLCAWVNIKAYSGVDLSGGEYGTIFGQLKMKHSDGKLMYLFDYDDNQARQRKDIPVNSTNSLTLGEWHHVIVSFRKDTGMLGIYIDGLLDSFHNMTALGVHPSDSVRLYVSTIGGWIRQGGSLYDSTLNGYIGQAVIIENYVDLASIGILSGVRTYPSLECAQDCLGVAPHRLQPRLLFLLAIPVILAVAGIVVGETLLQQTQNQPSSDPPISLDTIVGKITNVVGFPATTDHARFPTRAALGIPNSVRIHLDIGGEGFHEFDGVESGFLDAININAQQTDSQDPTKRIPYLVFVNSWQTSPPYPVGDGFADRITLQGAPLEQYAVQEMVRVLRRGGEIGLWIDSDRYRPQINLLASALHTSAQFDSYDEFNGKAGWTKTLLVDHRYKDEL